MDGILAPWHWIILIGVGLLVFGPKKLPELGSSLGRGIASFRHSLKETQEEINSAVAESTAASASAAPSAAADAAPISAPSDNVTADAASSDAEGTPQA